MRSDSTIVLCRPKTFTAYPAEIEKRFAFLTNNFVLPAPTVAALYKCPWQVELFFKWVKQYLRIKVFHGVASKAARTQACVPP